MATVVVAGPGEGQAARRLPVIGPTAARRPAGKDARSSRVTGGAEQLANGGMAHPSAFWCGRSPKL
jgi:hypothetical protein